MSDQDIITGDAAFVVAGVQLQVPGELTGTAQNVEDGDGNDSLLQLSTSAVGVGPASFTPSNPLHVGPNQTVRLELGQNSSLSLGGAGTLSVDASGVPAGRFVVANNGNVGINQASPQYRADVSGTLRVTSGVTFNGLPGTNSAPSTAKFAAVYIDTTTGILYFANSTL